MVNPNYGSDFSEFIATSQANIENNERKESDLLILYRNIANVLPQEDAGAIDNDNVTCLPMIAVVNAQSVAPSLQVKVKIDGNLVHI